MTRNLWMGILQGFAPLGLIIGYIFTGLVAYWIENPHIWRLGILMQAILSFPVIFYII